MSFPPLVRRLANAPGQLGLVVMIMALTVGATTVVAALINAIWLRPRAIAEPDRVVIVSNMPTHGTEFVDLLTSRDLEQLRQLPVFEGLTGQVAAGGLMGDFRSVLTLASGAAVETLAVIPDYFDVLGIRVRGRGFGVGESGGSDATIIISDRLWRTAFGADSTLLGREIETSLGPLVVSGIAPPGFQGARLGELADAWVPFTLSVRRGQFAALPEGDRRVALLRVPFIGFARLRPGFSLLEAERLAKGHSQRIALVPVAAVYGTEDSSTVVLRESRFVQLSIGACVFVLLAGSATLASLLLVRQERRRLELAIRLALGASRGVVIRELMAELALVAAIGGIAALGVTKLGIEGLRSMTLPGGVELARINFSIDWRVVAFAVGALIVVTAAAGLIPLLHYTRPSLALVVTVGTATSTKASMLFRRATLGIHAAATYLLLVGALLFIHILIRGFGAGAGFDVNRTVFVRVQPSVMQGVAAPAQAMALVDLVLGELNALGEVRIAVAGRAPIRTGDVQHKSTTVAADETERILPVAVHRADADYASALDLQLVAGRLLAKGSGPQAVVITESLAGSVTSDGNVHSLVGRNVRIGGAPYEVTGVIRDFAQGSIHQSTPFAAVTVGRGSQGGQSEIGLIVGTHASAASVVKAVREVVARHFPNAARLEVNTGRQLVEADLSRERLSARLLFGFGIVALLLGLIGTYGVVEHLLRLRWRDFGVRMSLGAHPRRLMRQLIRSGVQPVLVGIGGGAATALGATVTGRALIPYFATPGPIEYLAAGFVLLSGAMISAAIAAYRVFRISPMEALRVE